MCLYTYKCVYTYTMLRTDKNSKRVVQNDTEDSYLCIVRLKMMTCNYFDSAYHLSSQSFIIPVS